MKEERELERHKRILEQIASAKNRSDLPKISYSTIATYLATNVYFDGNKLNAKAFLEVVNKIVDYGMVSHPEVRKIFIKTLLENYPNISVDEIIEKYNMILNSKRIGNILYEIGQRNLKLDEIVKSENLAIHNGIIKKINNAFEIKDLPKVGLSELNRKLIRAVNDNDFVGDIKISEIKDLTNAYLEKGTYTEIENIVENICIKYNNLTSDEQVAMREQIIGALLLDETIEYTVVEIHAKEKRKLKIYELAHDETMDMIKDARRISQLPPNLTISTLTSYLNGNTTIYTNDDRIKAEDLKRLTQLLFDGYKWEDEVIINEIKNIVNSKYFDKNDAFDLLYNKFSGLPRTYYLVEEVETSLIRQREFIGMCSSNVNVYFIPNTKSPIEGGRFYNCYINRVNNLNLEEILPLDLESIISPEMDVDSIEWYVQEYADPTFKIAGGIILNKDETIGNVNVFRPNDGKIGVSKEEKEKLDKIENLDKQIKEKEDKLASIDEKLKQKQRQSQVVEEEMNNIISDYEQKALELQIQLFKNIQTLKSGLKVNNSEDKARVLEKEKGKGLK